MPGPSISPAGSGSVKVPMQPNLQINLFKDSKPSTRPLPPIIPISPSPGPETPPQQQHSFTPMTPPLLDLAHGTKVSYPYDFPKLNEPVVVDGCSDMEDVSQPSPVKLILFPTLKSTALPEKVLELVPKAPIPDQNPIFFNPTVQIVAASASKLEMYVFAFTFNDIHKSNARGLPFSSEISMDFWTNSNKIMILMIRS